MLTTHDGQTKVSNYRVSDPRLEQPTKLFNRLFSVASVDAPALAYSS